MIFKLTFSKGNNKWVIMKKTAFLKFSGNFFLTIYVLFFSQYSYSQQIRIPHDQPTIQAGIDIACKGDTVLVYPGTYYENIDFKGKSIILGSLFLTTQDTFFLIHR